MKLLPTIALGLALSASTQAYNYSSFNSKFTPADYREALNMGLKFFGGQRCGNTHNWMLQQNKDVTKKYCHIKDGQGAVNGGANGSYDLAGGWHDCGDHIKVANTMGYAAVSLLAAYDIWPTAFQDNYDGEYGQPNGIADVLDEAKVATDYFIKCFLQDGSFVYYVGSDGDHNRWVTSSVQSGLSVENGGDPRPVWTSTSLGGPQAANYASALALMARHYPDADYRKKCYDAALRAYSYAVEHKSQQASIPVFYPHPNKEWTDELSLAAISLYYMTKDKNYIKEAEGYLQGKWESNSPLAWDTESDYAYYYILRADPDAGNGQGGHVADFLRKNVFGLHIPNGEKDSNGFPYYTNNWGTNKLALGGAVCAALYLKLVNDTVLTSDADLEAAKNFNRRIVDYVLGDNEFSHTFLHGYKGDMTFRIHHRNAMGRNDNPVTQVKNTCEYMFASGGVIGGPSSTGAFANVIEGGSSYTETEGGCDYNAPFVAAIASIVADLCPNNEELLDEAALVSNGSDFNVYPTNFSSYIVVDPLVVAYSGGATAQLVDMAGRVVLSQRIQGGAAQAINTSSLLSGVYVLRIATSQGQTSFKVVKE